MIDGEGGEAPTVLDTKWKRIKGFGVRSLGAVAPADVYQLYGYADRYAARNSILLYPRTDDSPAQRFRMDRPDQRHLTIAFVDVRRDLRLRSSELQSDLRNILTA